MIWEPLYCGSFLDKIYHRLDENVLEIPLNCSFTREYEYFRPEVQATLIYTKFWISVQPGPT